MSMRVLAVCLIVVCLECNRHPSPIPQDATSVEQVKKPSIGQRDPATLVNKMKFQNYEAVMRAAKSSKREPEREVTVVHGPYGGSFAPGELPWAVYPGSNAQV